MDFLIIYQCFISRNCTAIYDAIFVAVKTMMDSVLLYNLHCCIICLEQKGLACFGLAGWSSNLVVFISILQYLKNVTDFQGLFDHQYTFHVQSCIITADFFFALRVVKIKIYACTLVLDFSRWDGLSHLRPVPSQVLVMAPWGLQNKITRGCPTLTTDRIQRLLLRAYGCDISQVHLWHL